MRILQIIKEYYPALRGGPIYFKAIADRLVQRGYEVRVFSSDSKKRRIIRENINGVDVVRFPALPNIDLRDSVITKETSIMKVFLNTHRRLSDLLLLRGLVARPHNFPLVISRLLLELEDFDLIHAGAIAHSCPYTAYVTNIVARLIGKNAKPLLLTPFFHTQRKTFGRLHLLQLCKKLDGILVETEYEAEFLRARGVDPTKLFVVGIGVNPAEYSLNSKIRRMIDEIREKLRINEDDELILWLGGRNYYKGFHHLVLSMRRIWRRLPHAKLIIAGPEANVEVSLPKGVMRELSHLLHNDKRIIDLGIVTDDVKKALLYMADVLAMPSVTETIPLTFLEAWACGKPVVAADIPTLRSAVRENGDGAELCRFADLKSIASCIEHILRNKEYAKKVGRRGYEKVISYYNWEAVTDRIEKAYRKVLEIKYL